MTSRSKRLNLDRTRAHRFAGCFFDQVQSHLATACKPIAWLSKARVVSLVALFLVAVATAGKAQTVGGTRAEPVQMPVAASGAGSTDSGNARAKPNDGEDERGRDLLGMPVNHGFVLLDGAFLQRPYTIKRTPDAVWLNGYQLPIDIHAQDFDQHFRDLNQGRREGRLPRWMRSVEASIEARLHAGDVLIVNMGTSVSVVPGGWAYPLAETLESNASEADKIAELMGLSDRPVFSGVWRQLVADYQPGLGFYEQSKALYDEWQANQRVGDERIMEEEDFGPAYMQYMPMVSVVASVLAIVIVVQTGRRTVIAHGPAAEWRHIDPTGQRSRLVLQMIALLVGLNALDLFFTLSAVETGKFFEANPITNPFIDSPATLSAFKIAMVLIGCTLLMLLRHRRAAEVAGWWLCVGYTLVTLRWVIVNTHMVG